MNVYGEYVWVMNSLLDYLLLLTTARLSGCPIRRRRFAVGACAGGMYAVLVLMQGFSCLRYPLLRFSAGVLLALFCFKREKQPTVLFPVLSASFAGLMILWEVPGEPDRIGLLLCGAWMFYIFLSVLPGRSLPHREKRVELYLEKDGRSCHTMALYDSGNLLTDPIRQQNVLFLHRDVAVKLLPGELREAFQSPMTAEELFLHCSALWPGGHMILMPYRTVDSEAFILAFSTDTLLIGGQRLRGVFVGISDCTFDGCPALWGGTVGKGRKRWNCLFDFSNGCVASLIVKKSVT